MNLLDVRHVYDDQNMTTALVLDRVTILGSRVSELRPSEYESTRRAHEEICKALHTLSCPAPREPAEGEGSAERTLLLVEGVSGTGDGVSNAALEDVARQIDSGDWAGRVHVLQASTWVGKDLADLMARLGCDPRFMGINEDGKEVL